MSVPSDGKLLKMVVDGILKIRPFCKDNIQPSSLDLTLDEKVKFLNKNVTVTLGTEVSSDNYTEKTVHDFELSPGQMVLGQIRETIGIPRNFMANIHNRSSLARLGLSVALASYINPGYEGNLPIIIKNAGNFTLKLVAGMRICQLVLHEVKPSPLADYSERKDVKYQKEKNRIISKLHLDHEFEEYFKRNNDITTKKISDFIQKHSAEKATKFLNSLSEQTKRKLGIS